MIKNVGRLDHLHHKGGLASVDLILSADAGENTVYQADTRLTSGHKTAHLRHQYNESYSTQEGRFTAHVGAGDETHDLTIFKCGVIGDKTFAVQGGFYHRMAALMDFKYGVFCNLRASVPGQSSHLSEREVDIQFAQSAGGFQQVFAGLGDLFAQVFEETQFDLMDAFFSVQHQRLIFLHLRGDVTLGVD
ncbi:hypothetical protein SDC9_146423 [bioreactor metagenome]|uniref:Uncharacterized protein n=1 Tax=bioreactor metagenome TaxID=1076179 RepID=A0A645EF62_9ZZZZ